MVKRPTNPFWDASHHTPAQTNRLAREAKDEKENRGDKPDTIRDKDNDAPRPKPPSQARYPAPNMAPPGSVGIKRGLGDGHHGDHGERRSAPPSIRDTHPDDATLIYGRITGRPDIRFFYEPDPDHEGVRIKALELQRQGRVVAQYQNNEWTKRPHVEIDKQTVNDLQDKFGRVEREFKPIVQSHTKDRDMDR